MYYNKKSRRNFLLHALLTAGGLAGGFGMNLLGHKKSMEAKNKINGKYPEISDSIPKPTEAQLRWQNSELAALVCWDLHAFDGKVYDQGKARITPIENYNIFNPQKYDTDQWIATLKEAGFNTAIFTVSHETGFFFYQSDVTPYCMKALKWRNGEGDVLRDFKNSCEKYDMYPGVYIGTRWNAFYGVHDFDVLGSGTFAKNRQAHYNHMIEGIVEEIFTRYGDWSMVWFDGGAHGPEQGGPDVLPIFEKHQPNCLFYHNLQRADMRWGGSETGTVPYPCWGTFPYHATAAGESARPEIRKNNFALLKTGDPDGDYYMPAMSDAPLRGHDGHDWFWEPGGKQYIYPLEDLIHMYYNSVGHNTTLILGVTPNPEGLIPDPDANRLKAFGAEIKRRFSDPLAETSGTGDVHTFQFEEAQMVNQLVLKEDIIHGERVREFVLEGKSAKGWEIIFEGSCIGHKFIYKWDGKKYSALRLKVNRSVNIPIIKRMSAYHIDKQ